MRDSKLLNQSCLLCLGTTFDEKESGRGGRENMRFKDWGGIYGRKRKRKRKRKKKTYNKKGLDVFRVNKVVRFDNTGEILEEKND